MRRYFFVSIALLIVVGATGIVAHFVRGQTIRCNEVFLKPASFKTRGPHVEELQWCLKSLGYLDAKAKSSGFYWHQTRKAVQAFYKKELGVTASGKKVNQEGIDKIKQLIAQLKQGLPPLPQWAETLHVFDENIFSIAQTPDRGYIFVAYTDPFKNGWIVKLNERGEIVWQKSYTKENPNRRLQFFSVAPTSDGGYIAAGSIASLERSRYLNGLVVKLTALGDIEWQRYYQSSPTLSFDQFFSVVPTQEGGYIVAGTAGPQENSDAWVVKLDRFGNVVWQKQYGGVKNDGAVSVLSAGVSGYVVGGTTESMGAGGSDAWVLRLDRRGNVDWEKAYGTADFEVVRSLSYAKDGGYIAAGYTGVGGMINYLNAHAWLLKFDDEGNVVSSPLAVYVLKSADRSSDLEAVRALEEAGHRVTLGVETPDWNGTQVNLSTFDAVAVLYNANSQRPLDAKGTEALSNYVSQGGGLVTGEWLSERADPVLSSVLPVTYCGKNQAASTKYTQGVFESLIHSGLPAFFTFQLSDFGGSESCVAAKQGSSVFYTSANGGGRPDSPGLTGWRVDKGRVVSFSTLLGATELKNAQYRRLFVNAVEWAAPRRVSLQWQKMYGGSGDTRINFVVPTPDGGYLTAGSVASSDRSRGDDFWILKVNVKGEIVWQKLYALKESDQEGNSIFVTADNGFIAAGRVSKKILGLYDGWLLKFDSKGSLRFRRANEVVEAVASEQILTSPPMTVTATTTDERTMVSITATTSLTIKDTKAVVRQQAP